MQANRFHALANMASEFGSAASVKIFEVVKMPSEETCLDLPSSRWHLKTDVSIDNGMPYKRYVTHHGPANLYGNYEYDELLK